MSKQASSRRRKCCLSQFEKGTVTDAWKNKELGAVESPKPQTSPHHIGSSLPPDNTLVHTHKQTNWGLKKRIKRKRRRSSSSSSSRSGTAEQSKQRCSSLESIPCCKEDSQSGNFIFLEQQATNKLDEHRGTEQENTIWSIWIQHQIRNFLLSLKKTFSTNKETDDSRERNTKMEEDVDYVNDYVKAVVSLQRQTDRRQNKSTSGENRIAAAAAIALQTMQDLSGTPAHNIVQNFPRLEDAYITSSAGAATQPRGCWIMPFLGRSQEREQPDTDKDQQR